MIIKNSKKWKVKITGTGQLNLEKEMKESVMVEFVQKNGIQCNYVNK